MKPKKAYSRSIVTYNTITASDRTCFRLEPYRMPFLRLYLLVFADDIVLLARKAANLQYFINIMREEAQKNIGTKNKVSK